MLPEVQHTCSRVLIINRGRIVADGAVDALASRAAEGVRVSVEVRGTKVDERLAALPGVQAIERRDSHNGSVRLSVVASGGEDIRPAIFELAKTEGWTLLELHQETGTLEDLFRYLTAAEETA